MPDPLDHTALDRPTPADRDAAPSPAVSPAPVSPVQRPLAACGRCSAPLPRVAAYCERCGHPIAGPPVAEPFPARPRAAAFASATGRARSAGWFVTAGGIGIVLSTMLPWFSWLGIDGGTIPFAWFLALASLGALVAYFGVRVLKERVTRAVMVTLWVVAVSAVLFTAVMIAAANDVERRSFGTVNPAAGLYLAVLGIAASVVGTVLLQTTRRAGPS